MVYELRSKLRSGLISGKSKNQGSSKAFGNIKENAEIPPYRDRLLEEVLRAISKVIIYQLNQTQAYKIRLRLLLEFNYINICRFPINGNYQSIKILPSSVEIFPSSFYN